MIMISIIINQNLRQNQTFKLIFNLALADLTISSIVDSFSVFGIFLGKRFFDNSMGLCYFIGSACLISCGTSLLTMGFLAFNR